MRRPDLLDYVASEGMKQVRAAGDAANGYPGVRAKIERWIAARPDHEQDDLRRALLSPKGKEAVQ
jgi:hypothetical protein